MQRNVFVEAPCVGKAKTKHKARFNNHKKVHTGPTEKNKVSQQGCYEHNGQHSYNGTDDSQFTSIEQCEKTSR